MTYFSYVKKNITILAKRHSAIFILIFISEIITILSLFFSYGLFYNTQEKVGELEEDQYVYWYRPLQTEQGTNDIKRKFKQLTDYLGDDFNYANIHLSFNGQDGNPMEIMTYLTNANLKELEMDKKPVFYLVKELKDHVNNGKIALDGKEYDAVVTNESEENHISITIPLSSVSSEFNCSLFMLTTQNRPTKQSIEDLNNKCFELFGANCQSSPKPVDLMEIQINNSFYFYTFLIVILVTLNLSVFYRYIISLRTKMIKVYMISGATSFDVVAILVIEAVISMLSAFAVSYIVFRNILLPICSKIYPNFAQYYSSEFYVKTLLMYIAVSILLLAIMYTPYIYSTVKARRG